MKKTIITTIVAGMIITAGSAVAGHGHNKWRNNSFTDRARVTNVEPIFRMVKVAVPREECYTREVRNGHRHGDKAASTVIGGIIGGAVGHRLGKHKKGPTVAGAIIGAAVGNSIGKNKHRRHDDVEYEEVCDTHTDYRRERQLDGYEVTYRYRGEFFTTRMDERPGKRIKVKVHVSPVVH